MADKENKTAKADTLEKKDQKDYPTPSYPREELSYVLIIAVFPLAEKIQPAPTFDKLTPPPNLC